jgi:hypothetical protein
MPIRLRSVSTDSIYAIFFLKSDRLRPFADQSGRLLVKNVLAIRAGQTSLVDYNDDRILFYPNANTSDFSAVVRTFYCNDIL